MRDTMKLLYEFILEASNTKELFHGTPYGNIESFDEFKPPVFFTPNINAAMQYATGAVVGASRTPGGLKGKPAVYSVDVTGLRIFDFRKPDHRKLYAKLREEVMIKNDDPRLSPDRLPELEAEGFIMSHSMLPGYGYVRPLMRLLMKHGFDSLWTDEGTQGISLAVFDPKGKIRITNQMML